MDRRRGPALLPNVYDDRKLVERFEAEAIDRLFALNAMRADAERPNVA